MITKQKAKKIRKKIELLAAMLSDNEALETPELFPRWLEDAAYSVDDRVRYEDILYKCLIAHNSQPQWTPIAAPSLWAEVLVVDEQILEWKQPDSTNPYMKCDKVLHNEKVWESDIDNNVWEPGIYGWTEVTS